MIITTWNWTLLESTLLGPLLCRKVLQTHQFSRGPTEGSWWCRSVSSGCSCQGLTREEFAWNVWSWNRWVLCAIAMLMYVLICSYMFLCSVTGVHMCVYIYIKYTYNHTRTQAYIYMYINKVQSLSFSIFIFIYTMIQGEDMGKTSSHGCTP